MDKNLTGKNFFRRRRILFVVEAVTLAHVARCVVLSRALDPERYEVHFACSSRYHHLFSSLPFVLHEIFSISTTEFLNSLSGLGPVWSEEALRTYVQEEIRIIDQIKPELIIGDLRISLIASTRLCNKPLVSIVNAYWSSYSTTQFCSPNLKLMKLFGVRLVDAFVRCCRSRIFSLHAGPINRVCRSYALSEVSHDLREILTYGDYVLYPDVPQLISCSYLPPNHRYLGAVLWSTEIELPQWWNDIPQDLPLIYINLGTSGQKLLLRDLVKSLAGLPLNALIATTGQLKLGQIPPNAFVAEFLPGQQAASRADLMISNGGSASGYQALAQGIPLLGLASNADQTYFMQAVQNFGAGRALRSISSSPEQVLAAVKDLLQNASYREAAGRLACGMAKESAEQTFRQFIAEILPAYPADVIN